MTALVLVLAVLVSVVSRMRMDWGVVPGIRAKSAESVYSVNFP